MEKNCLGMILRLCPKDPTLDQHVRKRLSGLGSDLNIH